jgi:hypothetical protein
MHNYIYTNHNGKLNYDITECLHLIKRHFNGKKLTDEELKAIEEKLERMRSLLNS